MKKIAFYIAVILLFAQVASACEMGDMVRLLGRTTASTGGSSQNGTIK